MNDSTIGSARFSRRLWVIAAIAALAMWAATVPAVARGAAPAVNNFNPRQGNVGTPVHVYGANFTGATSVAFNVTPVTAFTVIGPGNISTTVPSGATTGRISVTTPTGGTGTSSTDFTVTTTGGPTITGFSPNSGPIGTAVTINGTGFTGVNAVRFNGAGWGDDGSGHGDHSGRDGHEPGGFRDRPADALANDLVLARSWERSQIAGRRVASPSATSMPRAWCACPW